MLRVTTFEPRHLEQLRAQSPDWYRHVTLSADRIPPQTAARTFWNGPKVITCAGLELGHAGYAVAWLFRGADASNHAPFLVRQIRALMSLGAQRFRLHRIDAVVPSALPTWRRFMEMMGFRAESVMPRYGPQREEYMRYVLFPGE